MLSAVAPIHLHRRRRLKRYAQHTVLIILVVALSACANPFSGPRFVPSGLSDYVVLSLLVDPAGVLYAGTNDGVHRSDDEGRTWHTSDGLPAETAVPGLSQGPGGLYAATGNGVYRSVDGHDWQPLGVGLPTDGPVLAVAPHPSDPRQILAGTGQQGIFRSTDAGTTWQPASHGLPAKLSVYVLEPDPTQPARMLAGTIGAGLFRSDDGGATWQPAGTGVPPGANVFSIAGAPEGWLVIGTSVGLFRSTDGGQTWNWSRAMLGRIRVIALARDGDQPQRLVAGTDDGVYSSADAGQSWQRLAEGLPPDEHVGAVAFVGSRIIAGAGQVWALD